MIRLKKFISITLIAMMTLAGCGKKETATINIAGLKGPTTMGIVKLMEDAGSQKTENTYNFEMCTQPDEILPRMLSGELDIALIPANVASVLYNKSQGGITCIDINTLGVLYMVSGNPNISTMQDLDGKTVYMTGKGQTPDYVFSYLLKENGMTDKVTVEYKSEATEVAAVLAQNSEAIGVLPQPFVTAACAQNENLSVCMDLTAEWDKVTNDGSRLVTGVTVVRTAFLNDNKEAVNAFLDEHKKSAEYANSNVEETAQLIANAGIVEKAPVAMKALPNCNITFIEGKEMADALSGYLNVLFTEDPASVGGSAPGSDFYYIR